jgi:Type I restriction modification DNA specificity domain
MSEAALPDAWALSRLGRELKRRKERIEPRELAQGDWFYVGLNELESETGRVVNAAANSGDELASTKNVFDSGDILVSNSRPCLNRVARVRGVCATDIWVLRPSAQLDAEYATFYLRSEEVVQATERLSAGAALPRIGWSAFASINLPLPPLLEQRRIVAVLHQAEQVRRKRRQSEEKLKQLPSIPTIGQYDGYIAQLEQIEDRFLSASTRTEALFQSLLTRAFHGVLTAAWREAQALPSITAQTMEDTPETRLAHGAATEADWDGWRGRLREAMPDLVSGLAFIATTIISPANAILVSALAKAAVLAKQAIENYPGVVDAEVRQTTLDHLRGLPEPTRQALQDSLITRRDAIETTTQTVPEPDQATARQVLQIMIHAVAEAAPERDPTDPSHHLLRALSQEQYDLYLQVKATPGYVTPETLGIQGGDPVAVLRGLQLLAQAGLIQAVSLRRDNSDANAPVVFLPAFRALQTDDEGRADLAPAPAAPSAKRKVGIKEHIWNVMDESRERRNKGLGMVDPI